MRPSAEQRDLVVGTAYEGQRGPRHYGNYVSGAASHCAPACHEQQRPLASGAAHDVLSC